MTDYNVYRPESEADIAAARIRAAAPSMLSELERAQSELISALNDPSHIAPDMLRRWLKGVEEVIKRAKGV